MIWVNRSQEAPAVLAQGAADDRYRSKEVVDQLMLDFRGKCYICEVRPLQSAEVEHLIPHKGGQYSQRKFDWENLFLSCRHCNSVKAKPKYDDGIIDCCKQDPEMLLDQELIEDTVRITPLAEGRDVQLTAELIEEVFMSDTPALRGYESDMCLKELQKQMNLLYESLKRYQTDKNDVVAFRTIRVILKPESAFAGFARCYIRKHLSDYPELEPCVASADLWHLHLGK